MSEYVHHAADIPITEIKTGSVTYPAAPAPNMMNLVINVNNAPPIQHSEHGGDFEDTHICDEVGGFALAMQTQIKGTQEEWLSEPIETHIRTAEKALREMKAAIELRLDIKTIVIEAAKCGNAVMKATEVYIEEYRA